MSSSVYTTARDKRLKTAAIERFNEVIK